MADRKVHFRYPNGRIACGRANHYGMAGGGGAAHSVTKNEAHAVTCVLCLNKHPTFFQKAMLKDIKSKNPTHCGEVATEECTSISHTVYWCRKCGKYTQLPEGWGSKESNLDGIIVLASHSTPVSDPENPVWTVA